MIAIVVSSALGKLLHQYEDISHIPHQRKYLDLVNWLEQNQSKLVPTFPGIEDENMQTHFTLQTEKNISDAALKDLQNLAGIKGAYHKPEDSLPG